ncbi:MAG: NAD(P)-binding protein, partial [Acidimicrobiales bacterium]
MELDAIVVGGGHNGLICAAYLARAGAAVAVLEARPVLGGAPAQDEVGAAVDLHGGDQLAVRSAALIEELDLARHGLRFLDGAPALIALGAGETAPSRPLVLFHDLDRTLDGLARTHPDQVDGYLRVVRTARPAARLALALAEEPPGAFGALRQAARRGGA